MELDKKKYKLSEVENLISEIRAEYSNQITEQKQKNNDLTQELLKLQIELESLRARDLSISSAIKDAEEFALKLKQSAVKKYVAEVESLLIFCNRWRAYFDALIEKYPLYGKVVTAKTIFDEINNIISTFPDKSGIEKIEKILDDNKIQNNDIFDPKSKIEDYIAATSDNGFNMNDVLNPGKLELEDLCKELGLIDENL